MWRCGLGERQSGIESRSVNLCRRTLEEDVSVSRTHKNVPASSFSFRFISLQLRSHWRFLLGSPASSFDTKHLAPRGLLLLLFTLRVSQKRGKTRRVSVSLRARLCPPRISPHAHAATATEHARSQLIIG